MINFRTSMYSGLLVALLSLGACSTAPVMSDSRAMMARLSGASEVPPVTSSASGMVDASLNTRTNVLSWTVTYAGLSGPASAGHFHGPAMSGVNAGVALGLTGSLDSPISGTATLTSAQVADLMAGKWYLNLHTAANPGGEIRGQVVARP